MLLTERAIRQLIYNILLEGVREDADALRALLADAPEALSQFEPLSMKPKWVNWLADRYVRNKYPADDKLQDALPVVAAFAAADAAISQKYGSNPQFKTAVNITFPPGTRKWKNPADAAAMSTADMDTLLTIYKRPKDKLGINREDVSWKNDEVGTFGPWKLYFPTNQQNSVNIAGVDPVTHKPYTTWCTARTAGSNLFNNYAAHETMLFYAINTAATPKDPESRISLGFIRGKLNSGGMGGGVTVDAKNKGLKDADLARIFGGYYTSIIARAEEVVADHGGVHPVGAELDAAAKDPVKFNSMLRGLSDSEAEDLANSIFAHGRKISPEVEAVAINHKFAGVRLAIAVKEDLPLDAVVKLAGDSNFKVRDAISRKKDLPLDVVVKLAGDPSTLVRGNIAYRSNLPKDVVAKLAGDPVASVRHAVNVTNNFTENIAVQMASSGRAGVRSDAARLRELPTSVAVKLAGDRDAGVRAAIAIRKDLPKDLIIKMAGDADAGVRANIASRGDLPLDLVAKLAADSDARVRKSIAYRSDLPLDLVAKLVGDSDAGVRHRLTGRRPLPLNLVAKLAADPVASVRADMAYRLDLPPDLVAKLAADPDDEVRRRIAKRSDLTEDILVKLAGDRDVLIRMGVASMKDLPAHAVVELARDRSFHVRRYVALRKDLPLELIVKLAGDSDAGVRAVIARKKDLPEDLRAKLAADPDEHVRSELRAGMKESRRLAHRILREIKRAARN